MSTKNITLYSTENEEKSSVIEHWKPHNQEKYVENVFG